MLGPLLEDVIRNMQAAAQDTQLDEPAALHASAEEAGEGAGGSAAGQRRSKRKSSSSTRAEDSCEVRRQTGVVDATPEVPEQGCFCVKGCPGHAGECTNQVPIINTHDNVKVTQGSAGSGMCLKAVRDMQAGEIITLFVGLIIKHFDHPAAYDEFGNLHKAQEQTQKKFEYSAVTGSKEMPGSRAWVIPPQDVLLLKDCIVKYELEQTELAVLARKQSWQKGHGLGQFTQHTCCPKHVNAYLFPIAVMREAPRARGKKADDAHNEEEIMDVQALAIRAQKAISIDEEIRMHYVGKGKKGDLFFECHCCKCSGPGGVCGLP